MLDLQVVDDFIYEYFALVSVSKTGTHFHARCLLCGDSQKSLTKKRFHLDFNSGQPMYHCFNCHRSGSFLELYSSIKGMDISQAKKELFKYNPDYLIQKLSNRKKEKIVKEIKSENHNYIKDQSISDHGTQTGIMAKKWLMLLNDFRDSRKLSDEYELLYAYKGDYKGRIIIPIVDKHEDIIYFQARRPPKSSIDPKYMNPTIAKGSIIHNKHKFDRKKPIVVVEGLLDAMTIGSQGTTCLGAEVSDELMKEIMSLTDEYVILAPDNDNAGRVLMEKFMKGRKKVGRKSGVPPSKYAKKIRYFIFPKHLKECKDINMYSVNYGLGDIYSFILKNSYNWTEAHVKLHANKWIK